MYAKNNASPERIAVGAVVLIADGTVQTSAVSVTVTPQGGVSGAGGGTIAYEQGIVLYTPTQAETNYSSFIVTAYKASCIPVAVTIITTASATSGYAGLDWGVMANKTTTNALTGTTIATTQKVDVETIKTQALTAAAGITFPTSIASPTNITAASGVALAASQHVIVDSGTITTYTGNTPQTADVATLITTVGAAGVGLTAITGKTDNLPTDPADESLIIAATDAIMTRIGAAGAGLTALGDTRIANLDAAVSSRSTYAGGAVASVTAGVTVTTNNDKTGYGISSAAVQAIWDAATSALTTVGSIGKKLADWTIGTAQTGDAFARLGAPAGASVSVDIAAVKTQTAAIETDTGTDIPATLATIAGYVDTEVAAVLAAVDTEVASIKAKTDSLTFTAAGQVDANILGIGSDATALAAFKRAVLGNVIATVGAASTTTSIVTSSMTPAASVADQFKGRIVIFDKDTTTAALRGQATDITASTAGGVLTVTALTTAAVSGDTFSIL